MNQQYFIRDKEGKKKYLSEDIRFNLVLYKGYLRYLQVIEPDRGWEIYTSDYPSLLHNSHETHRKHRP